MICNTRLTIVMCFIIPMLCTGCYSFKGISIPPEISTYFVEPFVNRSANAPAGLETDFTDQLTDKINTETRLHYDDADPDIDISGSIVNYQVSSVAPQAGGVLDQGTTSFNRLTIAIEINYTNLRNEDENWTNTFSNFADFDAEVNFSDLEDELVADIFRLSLSEFINRAFTNW